MERTGSSVCGVWRRRERGTRKNTTQNTGHRTHDTHLLSFAHPARQSPRAAGRSFLALALRLLHLLGLELERQQVDDLRAHVRLRGGGREMRCLW